MDDKELTKILLTELMNRNEEQEYTPPEKYGSHVAAICSAFISLANECSTFYDQGNLSFQHKEMNVREDMLKDSFEILMNALFSDGIKWSRIIMLFLYISDYATDHKYIPTEIILDKFTDFFQDYCSQWIQRNGGWHYLIEYNDVV